MDQMKARRPFGLDDLWIETKEAELVKFRPNRVQTTYLDQLLPNWRQGDIRLRGVRDIDLKARQEGISTLIAVLLFLDTINTPNTHTIVMSYDDDGTELLFRMVSRFQANLDAERRPRTQRSNTTELYWPEIDCSYECLTAGSTASGRGGTFRNVHMSELAFWKSPQAALGLLRAVPRSGNAFLESTANGEGSFTPDGQISGNLFHAYWKQATRRSSEFTTQPYTPRFFPWFIHEEYRETAPPTFKRVHDRSPGDLIERYGDEEALAQLYGLTDDQLYWRRLQIDDPTLQLAGFRQEYPSNPDEAFLASGLKFFPDFIADGPDAHVVDPFPIPKHWVPFGMLDGGFGSPYCFLLGFITDYVINGFPAVVVTDELYGTRVVLKQQAQRVKATIESRGRLPWEVQILADPAMWAKEGQEHDNIGRADIEDFWEAGLMCVQANNNRVHGWQNIRNYLAAKDTVLGRALVIFRNCTNLVRTFPLQKHALKRQVVNGKVMEDLDTNLEDHALDALRYGLNSRPCIAELPRPEPYSFEAGPPDPERPLTYTNYDRWTPDDANEEDSYYPA